MLPISDFTWTEQQFMQLVSTFADVYFEGVSAPLESICYLGPYAWYIKENEIKQAKQKKQDKKARKKKKKKKKNKKTKNKNKTKTTTTKNKNKTTNKHW